MVPRYVERIGWAVVVIAVAIGIWVTMKG